MSGVYVVVHGLYEVYIWYVCGMLCLCGMYVCGMYVVVCVLWYVCTVCVICIRYVSVVYMCLWCGYDMYMVLYGMYTYGICVICLWCMFGMYMSCV